MRGIVSYGGYIPFYRLDRKLIFRSVGWINSATAAQAKGEKAVANYDEDVLTMAVAAGRDCLQGMDSNSLDGIFMASTSFPYQERLNSGIAATALDLKPSVRSADFSSSLKAGTTALLSALDSVSSETSNNILVCSAECRLGKMGSVQEHVFGDGAAAILSVKRKFWPNLFHPIPFPMISMIDGGSLAASMTGYGRTVLLGMKVIFGLFLKLFPGFLQRPG